MMNLHCNDNMNFNDGTCCKSSDPTTNIQLISLSVMLGFVFLYVVRQGYRKCCLPERRFKMRKDGRPSKEPQAINRPVVLSSPPIDLDTLVWSLAKLGIILLYFYVADRTNFLLKENKYFTQINFWLPVLYIAVVGLFFHENTNYCKVLNKDQVDEWKGWMVLVVMLYNMTGGDERLSLYMHVKVFISSYLFILGYNHFNLAWRRSKIVSINGTSLFVQLLKVSPNGTC